MAERKKLTGYVARCQCGEIVGAIDLERSDRKDAGQIMGRWIAEGLRLEPRFTGSWSCQVTACGCEEARHG